MKPAPTRPLELKQTHYILSLFARMLTVRANTCRHPKSTKLPTLVSDPLAGKIEGSFRVFMYSGHIPMHNTRHCRAYEYTATSNLRHVEDDFITLTTLQHVYTSLHLAQALLLSTYHPL
jgi:hypothetical protein